MKKILMFAVVAVGAVALTASALAGPGGTNRPFKGTGSGETTVTATGNPAVFRSASAGTIIATHLGKGTYTITATQTWTTCAVVAGTFTFVAANGATVFATVAGTTCEIAPFDNTSYESDLALTITGGTDRFTGATGHFDIDGTSTGPAGGPFDDAWTATGTISY
jgi:hypothetical protein